MGERSTLHMLGSFSILQHGKMVYGDQVGGRAKLDLLVAAFVTGNSEYDLALDLMGESATAYQRYVLYVGSGDS